ncbi:MAG: hypothetical protein LBK06_03265, partial [Planctomycetaceae bacterium]|nr:hypothetical protein [Planctomycetaceae bacterium]
RKTKGNYLYDRYAEAVLKFAKLNTAAQQREAIVQGRSLLPYRLRYNSCYAPSAKHTSIMFSTCENGYV